MESANTHHHLEDQVVLFPSSSSSSLASTPSCYGVGSTNINAWSTPISFLNTNDFSSYPTETFLNSREKKQQENTSTSLLSSHSQYANSMAPDLGSFHWSHTTAGNLTTTQSGQDLQLSRIKEELSQHYYRNYNIELISNEQRHLQPNYLNTRLFLKSASSGNVLTNKVQLSPRDHSYSSSGRGLSQIFPSINISNLNDQPAAASLDMDLEALDLLTCSRFSGKFGHSIVNQTGLLRDGFSYGSFDHMPQSHQTPLYGSNKVSASSNGALEAKRSSSKIEPKAPLQSAPKKSRLEARASCPPFKVRKEKLGDRIAALQQLVAPFGKTDTASVLTEAIGYIKFLQSQVETLSVPYMKASPNNSSTARAMKGVPTHQHESKDERKRDLKSRGLCLVPLSCLSYITDGGGAAAVWPPPHYGGAT